MRSNTCAHEEAPNQARKQAMIINTRDTSSGHSIPKSDFCPPNILTCEKIKQNKTHEISLFKTVSRPKTHVPHFGSPVRRLKQFYHVNSFRIQHTIHVQHANITASKRTYLYKSLPVQGLPVLRWSRLKEPNCTKVYLYKGLPVLRWSRFN